MTLRLIQKLEAEEKPRFRILIFQTELEAVTAACAKIAAGECGEFEIRDYMDRVIASDDEIRDSCNRMGAP